MENTQKSPTPNKKVRNATATILDGIQFKSKLEAYTYRRLKEEGITVEYEPTRFVLLDKFKYKEENVRAMTYRPDFVGRGFIIECKGFGNDAFPLRWKLFKFYLYTNNIQDDLYLVKNQKEVNEMIEKIKLNGKY